MDAEYFPVSQSVQTAEAADAAYVPATQSLQADAPAAEYLPAVQSAQLEEPAVVWNLPAGHAVQQASNPPERIVYMRI